MSIVVRYAPVPSSTVEQYDEVMRRLKESGARARLVGRRHLYRVMQNATPLTT